MASRGDRWPLVVRTRVIDEVVLAAVSSGCDRVLNLAAGLDTRPYRLSLPPHLEWVEADLGPMIDEKERMLAGEVPRCSLRRERVDLADAVQRRRFLEASAQGAKQVLVLTEGLLVYLGEEATRAIAHDLSAQPAVMHWVLDINSPMVVRMLMRQMGDYLERAPMTFAPRNGVAFFETLGWRVAEVRPHVREAIRLRRAPAWMRWLWFLPDRDPRKVGHVLWSAVIRLEPAR
jgi:methyltransferase (TIGR00027 family)